MTWTDTSLVCLSALSGPFFSHCSVFCQVWQALYFSILSSLHFFILASRSVTSSWSRLLLSVLLGLEIVSLALWFNNSFVTLRLFVLQRRRLWSGIFKIWSTHDLLACMSAQWCMLIKLIKGRLKVWLIGKHFDIWGNRLCFLGQWQLGYKYHCHSWVWYEATGSIVSLASHKDLKLVEQAAEVNSRRRFSCQLKDGLCIMRLLLVSCFQSVNTAFQHRPLINVNCNQLNLIFLALVIFNSNYGQSSAVNKCFCAQSQPKLSNSDVKSESCL